MVGVVTPKVWEAGKQKTAPGRACPGKGEEEPGCEAAGLSCSHSHLLFWEHLTFAEVWGVLVICRWLDVHLGKPCRQTLKWAGEECPAFLLSQVFPAVVLAVLCAGCQSCVYGKGVVREGCSALSHFMAGPCQPCPVFNTHYMAQKKKILGTVLQDSILLSPLCAHSLQMHLFTISSPPPPLWHSATSPWCCSAISDPSPRGICMGCIPGSLWWGYLDCGMELVWIYTACTSLENSLCSELLVKMELPWHVSLASGKVVDGSEKLFLCCFCTISSLCCGHVV